VPVVNRSEDTFIEHPHDTMVDQNPETAILGNAAPMEADPLSCQPVMFDNVTGAQEHIENIFPEVCDQMHKVVLPEENWEPTWEAVYPDERN
jgi:hypothetical protein